MVYVFVMHSAIRMKANSRTKNKAPSRFSSLYSITQNVQLTHTSHNTHGYYTSIINHLGAKQTRLQEKFIQGQVKNAISEHTCKLTPLAAPGTRGRESILEKNKIKLNKPGAL